MKTMKQLCQEALDIQNACNGSGVVHSWSNILPDLRAAYQKECNDTGRSFSTEGLNKHPVNILFVDKMMSLTGVSQDTSIRHAYQYCMDMASAVDPQLK